MEHPCPPWRSERADPERSALVAARLEEIRAAVVAGADDGFADAPTATLRRWHRAVFTGVAPLECYAGGVRGADPAEPCLRRNVRTGSGHGAKWQEVAAEMTAFDQAARALIAEADGLAAYVPPQPRSERVLDATAWIAARIIRIHPFLNGNGRMSRLATAALLHRFGFPAGVIDLEPAPDPPYYQIGGAAMTGDHRPMHDYLMSRVGVYPAARLAGAVT